MASNTYEYEYFGSDMYEDEIQILDVMNNLVVGDRTSNTQFDSSVSGINIFKTPERLVYTDEAGLLQINGNVLSQLSRVNRKINVVGVCGLYRTGKSYLMNWIAGERKGFDLGDTIQSETKGIWIWCKKHPKQKDQVLVLIDTEGLDDPEKGDPDHDNKLFCLTLLLSSTLIINVKDVLNYTTLDKLSFIASLSDSIKILNGKEEDKQNAKNIPVASPRLIMCIRDFYLKNVKDGKAQTPDEYLEDNLKEVKVTKNTHVKFNGIKVSIKQYFPKRKCFTMAQPAKGEDLQKIETLDERSLDKTFLKDINALQKYVYERKPKYICNASKKPIDGADLAALITSYVKALREDVPIRCEDAYAKASAQRNERVLQKVMDDFKKEIENGRHLKSKQKLQDMFLGVFERTLTKYREGSFLYLQVEYETKAQDQMMAYVEMLKTDLSQACQKVGREILSKMYDEMLEKNVSNYWTPDGYRRYETDMNELKKNFLKEMTDYDTDDLHQCIDSFLENKKDEKAALYRIATGENYRRVHEEINKTMKGKLDRMLLNETEKRERYLQDELQKLQAKYEDLSKSMKSRRTCSIM